MNDPLEHATGVEKWELLKQKEGVDVSKATKSHCSKSSFFVQKFNFDFLRKLSIFWGVKNS